MRGPRTQKSTHTPGMNFYLRHTQNMRGHMRKNEIKSVALRKHCEMHWTLDAEQANKLKSGRSTVQERANDF